MLRHMKGLAGRFSAAERVRRGFSSSGSSKEDPILFAKDFTFKDFGGKASEVGLTPKKIFEHLDRRVIGQSNAKRVLAIAYSTLFS